MDVFKGSRDNIPEELKPKPDLEPLEVNKNPIPESTKQIGDQGDDAIPDSGGDEEIGDVPIEEETPETPKPEVPKVPKKDEEIQDRDAQKAYWRDKYLKEKEKEKGGKETVSSGNSLTLEAIKLGKKLEEYSEEEIDSIAKVIKSDNPNDILNALENPVIKQGIEYERTKVAEAKKTPAPSSTSFDTKSAEDIQNMSESDHKKLDEEYQRKHGIGRSGI